MTGNSASALRIRPIRLSAAAITSLADMVSVGHGIESALQAVTTESLPRKTRVAIQQQIDALRAGVPIEKTLDRLGLEIAATATRGRTDNIGGLSEALRADAATRATAEEMDRKLVTRVYFFASIAMLLALFTAWTAFVLVPNQIASLAAQLPEGSTLSPALATFEVFRNRWLALGGGFLLTLVGVVLLYVAVIGKGQLVPFLHEARLYAPFARSHARHACRARLLEALAYEQAAGIPVNQTVAHVMSREPVPRLRTDLGLSAARLDAGEPWQACLRGTLVDSPVLSQLTSVSGQGAIPTQGWRLAAATHRERGFTELRRGVIAAAAIVIVPSLMYSFAILHFTTMASTIASIEEVTTQVETFSREIDALILGAETPSEIPRPPATLETE